MAVRNRVPFAVISSLALLSLPAFGLTQARKPALPAPAIVVTLSRPIYWIRHDAQTGAPQMPADVVASATVVNWPANAPRPGAFTWHVAVNWSCPTFATHHCIAQQVFTQASPFHPDFGSEIRGGVLTLTASALLKGKPIVGVAKASIRAENPTHATVLRAFPVSRFGLIASKIGMWESGLRQFTKPTAKDPGGLPYASTTNDLGMMQLNVPSGGLTTPDQVWDWRANLQRGLDMFEDKLRTSFLMTMEANGLRREQKRCNEAVSYLNNLRKAKRLPLLAPPAVPPLSPMIGSGAHVQDEDPDKLALSQWERDAIRRYNGGREYSCVIQTDARHLGIRPVRWHLDPSRGGIRRTLGDPDYVRHVLQARSGLLLLLPKPARLL